MLHRLSFLHTDTLNPMHFIQISHAYFHDISLTKLYACYHLYQPATYAPLFCMSNWANCTPWLFHFHRDFHKKWHFAHPKLSFAHHALPFLAKFMVAGLCSDLVYHAYYHKVLHNVRDICLQLLCYRKCMFFCLCNLSSFVFYTEAAASIVLSVLFAPRNVLLYSKDIFLQKPQCCIIISW